MIIDSNEDLFIFSCNFWDILSI